MEEQLKEAPLLVSIQCITYNHEHYIRHCLDGFVMQKTNFRFEVIIHDDASTDNTVEIIRQYAENYPDIIKPIYEKENQYSKIGFDGIFKVMNEYSNGKYIAFCEGDDYWIDENKLQKQIDFLESNHDYGACYTLAHDYNNETGKYIGIWGKETDLQNAIISVQVPTCTAVIRKNIFESFFSEICYSNDWKCIDLPLWIYVSKKHKIKLINEITSVYRILEDSASHTKRYDKALKFSIGKYNCRLFFIRLYNLDSLLDTIIELQFFELYNLSLEYNKPIPISFYADLKKLKYKRYNYILKFLFTQLMLTRKLIRNYKYKNRSDTTR